MKKLILSIVLFLSSLPLFAADTPISTTGDGITISVVDGSATWKVDGTVLRNSSITVLVPSIAQYNATALSTGTIKSTLDAVQASTFTVASLNLSQYAIKVDVGVSTGTMQTQINAVQSSTITITGTPDGTKFLKDDYSWAAITGGGDMVKATDGVAIADSTTTLKTQIDAVQVSTFTVASLNLAQYANAVSVGASTTTIQTQLNSVQVSTPTLLGTAANILYDNRASTITVDVMHKSTLGMIDASLMGWNTTGTAGVYLVTVDTDTGNTEMWSSGNSTFTFVGTNTGELNANLPGLMTATRYAGNGSALTGIPTNAQITALGVSTGTLSNSSIDGVFGDTYTVVAAGEFVQKRIPVAVIITTWTISGLNSGTCTIDVSTCATPSGTFTSITGGSPPALSSSAETSGSVSGWTTAIAAGTYVRFKLTANTDVVMPSLSVGVRK